MKHFPLKLAFSSHAFSSCPSALLCQTCAALLKCWIINVHKHFKRWRAIALKHAWWGYIWWGYCFRQRGKVQTVFWASSPLMERNQMIKPVQFVFIPRTNTSGEHSRTLVEADEWVFTAGHFIVKILAHIFSVSLHHLSIQSSKHIFGEILRNHTRYGAVLAPNH